MGCNTSQEATKGEKSAESNDSRKEQSPSKTQATPPPSGKSEAKAEHHAATKIQAVFRGHQTRKSIMKPAQTGVAQAQSKVEPEPTKAELEAEFRADDKDLCNAATMIQASFRGHQSRKQAEHVKQPEPAKTYLPRTTRLDPRSHQHNNGAHIPLWGLAKQDHIGNPDQVQALPVVFSLGRHYRRNEPENENSKNQELSIDEEELDIDLTDPELNKAATKIQASFRGHKVRKDTDN